MKKKKISPYREFTNWLFNSVPTVELDDWVIKSLNPRSVLCMFGNLNDITIFLNDYFNKFDVMSLDNKEFYNFLKSIVFKYNIKWKDLSFYFHTKMDKSAAELRKQLPHLKNEEIYELLEYASDDPLFQNFIESIGLTKYKKTKIKKTSTKKITMKKWMNNFKT